MYVHSCARARPSDWDTLRSRVPGPAQGEYGCSERTRPDGLALDDLSVRVDPGTGAATQAVARDLALHRPGLLQAVIGLEAAIKSDAGNNDLLDHPEINNGYKSDLMIGITSPVASEADRR